MQASDGELGLQAAVVTGAIPAAAALKRAVLPAAAQCTLVALQDGIGHYQFRTGSQLSGLIYKNKAGNNLNILSM